jgi:hypothetical protein
MVRSPPTSEEEPPPAYENPVEIGTPRSDSSFEDEHLQLEYHPQNMQISLPDYEVDFHEEEEFDSINFPAIMAPVPPVVLVSPPQGLHLSMVNDQDPRDAWLPVGPWDGLSYGLSVNQRLDQH